MKLALGEKPKHLREIRENRVLYDSKNLKYVKKNWIFYWRFLAKLEDIGYRPRTIQRYYGQLRGFLKWLDNKSLRKVQNSGQGELRGTSKPTYYLTLRFICAIVSYRRNQYGAGNIVGQIKCA